VAEYLSVSETARGQGVSPSAVTRWILTGAARRDGTRLKLKAIRLPGGFRTTQQWIDEFIEILTRDRTGASMPAEVIGERARRAEMALGADGW
jgi:hypothetical protein